MVMVLLYVMGRKYTMALQLMFCTIFFSLLYVCAGKWELKILNIATHMDCICTYLSYVATANEYSDFSMYISDACRIFIKIFCCDPIFLQ